MSAIDRAIDAEDPQRGREWTGASRPIGEFIRDARHLSDEQIERILAYQRRHLVRFGEAAVALRLVERHDVLEALSQQFQYMPGMAGRELSRELVTMGDPFGDQAEAFRELRSRLLVEVLGEHRESAIAIVSTDVGDGKSYLAANLAVSFSQLGERTLLVDADMRTPRLHALFGVASSPGLSSVLAGFGDAEALLEVVPGMRHLYLAPAGAVPPNPVELLQRPRFASLLREMLAAFDHVVVDTPAASRGPDSRIIAARAGATLVVARKHRSRMDILEGLLGALARGPSRIAGVVMNEH